MYNWQLSLKKAITDPAELCRELALDPKMLPQILEATTHFPLRVPSGFIARMEKGNPQDPLLLQVLSQARELINSPGYRLDPLNEKKFNRVPGLLHKYHGRVLLTLSGACAIHCRYCFRRHFPYDENTPGKKGWNKIFDYLKSDTSITEIILSGGDPLTVKDNVLAEFVSYLEKITHLKRLRIHTRLPIVIPERITNEFIHLLDHMGLLPTIVIHCNHPNEIDKSVTTTLRSLQRTRTTLLNQSVLLKNVNDQVETLIRLSENLFEAGVLPYYLHLLDRVQGASHFEVSKVQAQYLIAEMIKRLPGYLVPKLVQEIADAPAKIPVITIL
ncbi:EF-P beta-lysylation protein EpmB [Coxiella-like endosymbiont of Rhipicephalus sanguineus]|uniref:EF-P beta-lysylation protein EpmB n=1 Tax=Coxiella-like endosymbiont of Rhipicephalus sanguineus TaxID=1955402 RepID=UPI00203C76A8|nr:EF-P beta-lysylation protein EpmB [Coxiella-like endosymbiont of Rhipicephalus sanguineus]MBT8506636.1 EF-P beta-lysylation protein EpmB [Coxiella-like endosymbiont of Rhipicephalus sanguineus]